MFGATANFCGKCTLNNYLTEYNSPHEFDIICVRHKEESTVERRLSGRRLYGLSNYPDQSNVFFMLFSIYAFFSGIFRIFSCKNLSFYADSLKEVEKKMLLFHIKN